MKFFSTLLTGAAAAVLLLIDGTLAAPATNLEARAAAVANNKVIVG